MGLVLVVYRGVAVCIRGAGPTLLAWHDLEGKRVAGRAFLGACSDNVCLYQV